MKNHFSNAHRYELQIISASLGMYYFDFEQKFGLKVIPDEEMQINTLKPEKQATKAQRRKKNKK